MSTFIDLSVLLDEKTPVYPGDPKTEIKTAGVLAKDGYLDHYVSFGTHVGTHMDAPAHMIENGKSLDQISIDTFVGRGVYVRTGKNIELAPFEEVGLREGEIVLIHTGMSDEYNSPSYFESYPVLSEEIAHYLIEKKIKAVGLDTCSPDRPPFLVHRILLGSGILIIENLTNLAALEGKDFTVYAFPIKLALDGAPVRVVAEVEG